MGGVPAEDDAVLQVGHEVAGRERLAEGSSDPDGDSGCGFGGVFRAAQTGEVLIEGRD